jgi:hypothetical protein
MAMTSNNSSERLAAAQAALSYIEHITSASGDVRDEARAFVHAKARDTLAAISDPALSDPDAERQRAIGEAVERLPKGCLLGQWDDESGWAVFSHDMDEVKGSGPDISEAIAAALPAAQEPE